jgi:leucyl aminopeptidase
VQVRILLSLLESSRATVSVARSVPSSATAVGIAVGSKGAVPRQIGLDRDALAAAGFEGKQGQTLVIPKEGKSVVIAVGVGDAGLDVAKLRDAAAAFARAASRQSHLATGLADVAGGVAPASAAQAVTEGVLLARYRYEQLKSKKSGVPLEQLTLVTTAERAKAETSGAKTGQTMASAAMLARDLANAPAKELPATRMAEIAESVARDRGLQVEVFGKADLEKMGCGGILGVNAGSTEPPRMVKLTYKPKGGKGKGRHLAMVGKGIMYDSGGINLKPAQGMQLFMKMDMAGAAAVLGAMSVLRDLDCPNTVTAFLMCTDNMPSGSATKMGDVLTHRNGRRLRSQHRRRGSTISLTDWRCGGTEARRDHQHRHADGCDSRCARRTVDRRVLEQRQLRRPGQGLGGAHRRNDLADASRPALS